MAKSNCVYNVYSTFDKIYVENFQGTCLARFCKASLEIFGKHYCCFYHIIPNRQPTNYDWELFKSKVKEFINKDINISNDLIPENLVSFIKEI